jgi:N6-adenosine-specific RNA methylase IME4
MKFRVIVADPPWRFDDKLQMSPVPRSADDNYNTLTLDDICNLNVKDLIDPVGCMLVMWVPSTMLVDGLRVLNAWGFTFKGTYVWVKMRKDMSGLAIGMGHTFRQAHEIAIIGVSGKVASLIENKGQRSACLAVNQGHSKKPEALQDSLDLMFPNANKLEMFARRQRSGWICTGDELDLSDIRDIIPELIASDDINLSEVETDTVP